MYSSHRTRWSSWPYFRGQQQQPLHSNNWLWPAVEKRLHSTAVVSQGQSELGTCNIQPNVKNEEKGNPWIWSGKKWKWKVEKVELGHISFTKPVDMHPNLKKSMKPLRSCFSWTLEMDDVYPKRLQHGNFFEAVQWPWENPLAGIASWNLAEHQDTQKSGQCFCK